MSRVELSIIHCYPVRQVDEDGNFVGVNDEVALGDGRTGIRQGREAIEVVVEDEELGTMAAYFDPLTGEQLKKTKKRDGLWSKDEKIWRKVGKGKGVQRRKWKE